MDIALYQCVASLRHVGYGPVAIRTPANRGLGTRLPPYVFAAGGSARPEGRSFYLPSF